MAGGFHRTAERAAAPAGDGGDCAGWSVPALRLSRFGRMSMGTRGATGVRSSAVAVSLRADLAAWQVVRYLPGSQALCPAPPGVTSLPRRLPVPQRRKAAPSPGLQPA